MKIKFLPQNIEVEATPDKSLLQIATENQLEIRSICKGVPSCAECRVRIKEGDNNVLPPNKAELSLIGTSYFIDGRRLSCQVHCFGDVTVDLTEQVERQENQTKKIRGFRANKQVESKAVNDMMLLNEKEEVKEQSSESRAEKAPEAEAKPAQAREQRHQQQGRDNRNQQQRGGGQQNQQKQQQNQNRDQKQNQQQGRGGGQQGKQQNQNKQAQGQNKQQQQQPRQQQNQGPKQNQNQNQNQNRDGQQGSPKEKK